ncbi:hypothetical protein L208DRAFT_1394344 [Tricholoma matsutake]|nr:hypothetical protein L208DRAFT_1394344 [Tricholoma matsutake 945]
MTFFFTLLALFGYVASAPLSVRDVFVPPILYPGEGTVWEAGRTYHVVWDVSNPPAQITNKLGEIVLANKGYLNLAYPLAKDFDILLGRYEVKIPADTVPGTEYAVVLFGDSGNFSPNFTITAN